MTSGIPGTANPDALLSRELGVRQLAANIFNYTVGSGIFLLPATAVLTLGTAAPLAYIACAVVIGLVVLCYAEAGSRVSATGGSYAYVETAMGPFFGFVAGCLVFTTGLFAASAIFTGFVRSLLALFNASPPVWVSKVLIIAVVASLVAINMRGVRNSARVLEGITLLKLLPLLLFVVIGAFFVEPSNLSWTSVPDTSTVLGAAGIMIFAFSGIEGATIPSGEVKSSASTVPRAILLALGAATVLYIAIQYVALGIMGLDLANTGRTPLAEAAGVALGPTARSIMIAAAVVSMFGYLTANVLSEPRGLFAMSRDGFLPKVLTRVDPKVRTPNTAIAIYGVMVALIALSGTFEWLTIFANLAALSLYFLCAIATLILRRRDVRTAGEPFVIPGGPTVPILACLAVAWLFFETARDSTQLYALLIALTIIVALYGLRAWRHR
ncbi:APC family permease [Povalibacter sp.]|uniref:APC family permease n=1 Tax=Povalibacter sp. TaxID=1962978 RepID=UPI002F40B341